MLAIFDGRVAKRPDCMKRPHPNAVSAMKDDFLVNHFTSVYPDSVVVSSDASFTFAYSLHSTTPLPRFRFGLKDNVFCMYQGFIEDIDVVKRHFHLSETDDEAILVIRAFRNLRQSGLRFTQKSVEEMSGNGISVLYESPSKLVVLASGSRDDLPIYWGIDARFNLVISNNDTIVEKACGSVDPFLSGLVYACCEGQTGEEALSMNRQPEVMVDLNDMNIPMPQSVESVKAMIWQADMDRSKPCAEKWEPPMPDFLKINTDGVTFKDGMIGIGVIARNSKGEIEFAATRRKSNPMPDLDIEMQAFIEGVYLAEGFDIRRCIFESVHLNLEKNREKIGSELMDMMVEKVGKMVVENSIECSVSFVSSSANKAARRLALHAKANGHSYWEKETPECIASIVASERPNINATIS